MNKIHLARLVDIQNDTFAYEDLMFDMGVIKFSNPTEQEYRAILVGMLESNWHKPLIKMVSREMDWAIENDKPLLYKMVDETIDYIQIGTNKWDEERYYVFQGLTEDRGFSE